MAALQFGSQNIRSGGIFFDIVRGFWETAQVRGTDVVVPSREGRIARNRIGDRRTILLKGYVKGSTASDFHTNMTALFAVMDGTVRTLTIDDNYLGTDGSAWTIDARYINASLSDLGQGPRYVSMTIELESIEPDWEEAA